MKDPCKGCSYKNATIIPLGSNDTYCQMDCRACARRAMRERNRYKAVYESELGVCQKHCDVVRELKRQVAELEGSITAWASAKVRQAQVAPESTAGKLLAEAARIAKRRAAGRRNGC